MNPQSHETGLNLPPPIAPEQMPAPNAQEAPKEGIENGVQSMEASPAAQQPAVPAMTMSPLPVAPPMPQPAAQSDDFSTTNSDATASIDDNDLIEKEWVNKAKAIVERTRDDPHKQSEELSGVKAEYMKKRYDKNVKVST